MDITCSVASGVKVTESLSIISNIAVTTRVEKNYPRNIFFLK